MRMTCGWPRAAVPSGIRRRELPHRDASEARVRYDWFPIHLASYVSYQSSDYSTDGTTVILTAVQMAHSVFRIEPCT